MSADRQRYVKLPIRKRIVLPALSYADLEQRLRYMKKVGGMYVKNGLQIARQILLELQIPDDEIQPGESAEGFLPFQELKLNTRELEVIIPSGESHRRRAQQDVIKT